MKKLILLVLIFAVTTLLIISKEKELIDEIAIENSKKIRPQKWEYVKDRLFDGQTEDVYKITGPILIKFEGATKNDSIAIERIKNELKELLPHKTVDYFESFVGSTEDLSKLEFKDYQGIPLVKLYPSVLNLKFIQVEDHFKDAALMTTFLSDGSIIDRFPRFRNSGNRRVRISPESVFFSFNTNLSLEKRKTYIQYELYRWLCFINPKKEYPISYNNSNKGIFATPDFTPENAKLNDLDTFLLQKLYADDFLEQFKGYLYENYPWRYASYFLNNNKAKLKAYLLVVVLGFFIFLLVFRPLYDKKYKYTYLNYFLPVLIIMLSLTNLLYIYKHIISLNLKTTWNSISYSYPLVVVLAIGISLFLWLVEKFMINKVKNFGIQLTFKVLFTFFAFNLPAILFVVFSESNDKSGFSGFYLPVLIFTIILAVSRGVIIYLKHYSEALVKEKDIELSHLRELKTQAELKSLHSQINPHFLYNALNSIAGLAHINADKTEQMALSLSDLFKYTINRKGKKVSTVLDEVTMVQNYLEIEQIRFGERLKFTINVDDDLKDEKIPMFIIQPLVENAVKHGISKIEDQGEIIITIKKVNKSIEISVTDNGSDFPEGLVSGYGLQSVYDLLKLSYGNKATLKWQNTPEKSITISIKNK